MTEQEYTGQEALEGAGYGIIAGEQAQYLIDIAKSKHRIEIAARLKTSKGLSWFDAVQESEKEELEEILERNSQEEQSHG